MSRLIIPPNLMERAAQWYRDRQERPLLQRIYNRIEVVDDCWIYHQKNPNTVPRDHITHKLVNRILYADVTGIELKRSQRLICTCPSGKYRCVNPAHYAVQLDNQKPSEPTKSKRPKGANHYKAQLTWEQVREIRRRRKQGDIFKDIAKDYSMSLTNIYMICRGITWKEDEENKWFSFD